MVHRHNTGLGILLENDTDQNPLHRAKHAQLQAPARFGTVGSIKSLINLDAEMHDERERSGSSLVATFLSSDHWLSGNKSAEIFRIKA